MKQIIEYSNIGCRNQNQDFVLSKTIGEDKGIYIVADGMGGYSDGDLAAKIAAEQISNNILNGDSIKTAVLKANNELRRTIFERGVSKMGSCLAGINICQNIGYGFWIGDSRIYLYRNGEQIYGTQDHTMIAEMEKHGKVSFAQRERYGHIVSRGFMGSPEDVVDEIELTLLPDDEIILCSDGIHKTIPVDVLLEMIHTNTLELKERNEDFDDNHSFIYVRI